MTDLFTPIAHESVANAVVAQIEDMIATGVLRQNTRLPSERELAASFDVSRPKIREALKTLEERGLVVVRRGEGTFIAQLIGEAMLPPLLDLYARHSSAFFDYLEYRHEQEGFAAGLAANRATDADREVIAGHLSNLEAAHRDDDPAASKASDMAFHASIIDACHNSLLVHTMTSIYELSQRSIFYNRDSLRSVDGSGELLLSQHRRIAEAVLNGRSDEARAAAQAHIAFVERSFREANDRLKREAISLRRRALLGAKGRDTPPD